MEEFQRGGREDLSRKRYSTCLGRRTDLNTVVDLSMNFEQIRDRNHALLQRYRQETVDPESLEIMRRNFGSKFKSRNNGRWKDLYPCRLPDCVKPAKIVRSLSRSTRLELRCVLVRLLS
jgi:hypothetical protein